MRDARRIDRPMAADKLFWSPMFSVLSPAGARARLSILIFHRVLPQRDPLFPGEVDAGDFDRICRWLKSWCRVLPLDEAVAGLKAGRLPDRAAVITFDDGYADNHDVALPILQRHGLSATFYIASGFLDGGRMWNDTVIEAVRRTGQTELDLSALGLAGIGRLPLADLDQRRSAIGQLLSAIKYRPIAERLVLVQAVADAAGVTPPHDLMMSSDQLRAMHRSGMGIGAHTLSHPILATLTDAEARAEIDGSRQALQAILGAPVRHFAYPNGVPGRDFNEDTARLAAELGFDSAVTTAPGAASQATDPYRLPRFTPWDRTRARFGLRMMQNLWTH